MVQLFKNRNGHAEGTAPSFASRRLLTSTTMLQTRDGTRRRWLRCRARLQHRFEAQRAAAPWQVMPIGRNG